MNLKRTFITLLAFLLAACKPEKTGILPTSIQLSPTFTQVASTLTPTITYSPSSTSKPTVTRTLVPTYTPATPSLDSNASYTLRDWTPSQADLMIDQISSHLQAIEEIGEYPGVYGRSYYMEQYQYLAHTELEALLRFPDSPQADTWRWDVCYNLAYSYLYPESTDAPELSCYAKLIENGLNSGQADLSKISEWFKAHESRVAFEITSHTSPQGYNSSHIITLDDNAFLWLLEKDENFQATGLMSSMFFFRESFAKFQLVDLTGDDYSELVLYFSRAYCCGRFSNQFIYDLSSGTPERLTFTNLQGTQSNVTSDYDSYITRLDDEKMPGLVFNSHYGNPLSQPCAFRQYEKYLWNYHQFELVETWYGFDDPNENIHEDHGYCHFVISKPPNQDEINFFAHLIRSIYGDQIPGFRQFIPFHLGEYYGRLGNYERAFRYFSDVAAATSSNESESEYIKVAQTLLDNYKKADDFYKACSKVEQCDSQGALEQAIENIRPDLFPLVSENLQKIGVSVKDSGVFDFDGDGSVEQWLVVHHPGKSEREFWILVKGNKKIDALFVTNLSSAIPEINHFEVLYGRPIIELKTPKEKVLFSLQKMNISEQPYIVLASPSSNADDKYTFWQQSVDQAVNMIFDGTNPAIVRETLLRLKQSKNYDCKTYRCDQLYYFLGLANELADDQPSAVDAYLQLWKEYPDSPYTIMARSKLEYKTVTP